MHVLTLAPVPAAVLLHESYQKTAGHLIVFWVIILLQQSDLILRVDPKRVCTEDALLLAVTTLEKCYHSIQLELTGMIPAASSGAASPPRAVELDGVPVAESVLAQNVRGQVTDL